MDGECKLCRILSLDGEEGRVTLVGVGPTPLEAWACVQLLQDVHVAVAPTTHWAMHSGQRCVVRIVLRTFFSVARAVVVLQHL